MSGRSIQNVINTITWIAPREFARTQFHCQTETEEGKYWQSARLVRTDERKEIDGEKTVPGFRYRANLEEHHHFLPTSNVL